MEKRLPFHQQLKRERELRGWSQADVASRLGIDSKTVNRWESGKRLPRPYHRQALCELFGKNAEELGLLEKDANHSKATPFTLGAINPQISSDRGMPDISRGPSLPTPISPLEHTEQGVDTSGSEHLSSLREDWGEAPHIRNFYGRDEELDTLRGWIIDDNCRVVAVLGNGGAGKTTLSTKLAEQIKDAFECVFWRSLQNAPPLEHILKQCIQFFSDQQHSNPPELIDDQISLLIQYLRGHRCLLVLDNAESILQAGQRVGQYLEGYESYGTLIQRIGEAQHTSCLLLTSREKPKEIALLEGKTLPVQSLHLPGVGYIVGRELLKEKELFGSNEQWIALVNLYSGNPLALKLVSEYIKEIFGGDIAEFLEEEEIVFGDINDLLDQQFHRLSMQEQEILYWLAIERDATSLESIRENFVRPVSKGALLEAVNSLQRRSLIETKGLAQFTLQPAIMEYVTDRLTKQAYEEFTGVTKATVGVWTNYALMKAQAKDHMRDSQVRLILGPVAEQLLSTLGKERIEQKLRSMLSMQRQVQPQQRSYLAGNALNLLIHLHSDLRGADFSSLMICQAYLQNIALPDINFADAYFAASVFTNTFGNILSVAFSLQGDLFAAGTTTGEIWIYQALSGTPFLTCRGHTDGVWSVAFSPDGQTLASSSDDQSIRLWGVRSGHCLKTLQGHTNRVRSVAFTPDGRVLASGSDDKTVRLWDVSTGHCFKILSGHTNRVWSVAFSANAAVLASAGEDQTVRLWDTHSGLCLKTLQSHTHGVRSVAFSPKGQSLVSGGEDQTIRLWEVSTGYCLKTLQGYANRIWSIAFGSDGHMLVSGSEDQAIRLWDVNTGRCLYTLQDRSHGARSVAFSPDGQYIASGGEDQTVRLWSVNTGRCLYTLKDHSNWVWFVAFSPDGHMLASGSEDQSVRLWDVSSGHCLHILRGHTSWVRSVAFSTDGKVLASASDDQTIKLWETSTGRCLHTLEGHLNRVRSVAFSPDGQILASGGDDGTIKLWDVRRAEPLKTFRSERPYERMNITNAKGLTEAQKATLKALGAIENEEQALL